MFVDTSGWASAVDRSQTFHELAGDLLRRAHRSGEPVVTTNLVLAELVSLLTSPLRFPRQLQIQYLSDLRKSSWIDLVFVDASLDAAAWELWASRPDKTWSLVDCSRFVVMERRALTSALTTDHHFEQAGYGRLLK